MDINPYSDICATAQSHLLTYLDSWAGYEEGLRLAVYYMWIVTETGPEPGPRWS